MAQSAQISRPQPETHISLGLAAIELLTESALLQNAILSVIKLALEHHRIDEINATQAKMLCAMTDNRMSVGSLTDGEFYTGSNVSYNVKKLVQLGYLDYEAARGDKRSKIVSLTSKGRDLREKVLAFIGELGPQIAHLKIDTNSINELSGALRKHKRGMEVGRTIIAHRNSL